VTFKRITYRSAGASAATERTSEASSERRGGRRRRRRGGSGRGAGSAAATPTRAPHAAPAVAAAAGEEERHGASQEQLQQVIARLAAADPAHGVTLDALTVALKAAGFQRPPGSPRLVTRLRRMKDLEVRRTDRFGWSPHRRHWRPSRSPSRGVGRRRRSAERQRHARCRGRRHRERDQAALAPARRATARWSRSPQRRCRDARAAIGIVATESQLGTPGFVMRSGSRIRSSCSSGKDPPLAGDLPDRPSGRVRLLGDGGAAS
jgi:hypothetical protein